MPRRYLGSFVTYNPVEPTASAASGMWPLNQQFQEISGGTWPLTFGDPYFNYTTLLLSSTSLSNANNNLFVDSSGAFNPVSRTGNTTQGSFAPYGSYWSNYSDNSGDYLTAGSGSSAFAFGTGNFTIEGWFYSNVSTAPWKPMISVGGASQGQLIRINQSIFTSNNWGMLYPNDAGNTDVYFDTGAAFPINQWVHVALVRNGTTLTLYQNGVNVLQKTVGFNFTNTTGVAIGYGQYPADGVFGGYMSNIRIVKGTAVYTANFTPPTTPLTAISGTSLLTCQSNRFRDASSNNFAVTPAGDIRVTDFSPFLHTAPIQYNQSDITNWSGYFDGTGDLLSTPTSSALGLTGDWTVETWVYPTSYAAGANAFFDNRAAGTGCGLYYSLTSYTGGPGAVGYATNTALVAVSTIAIPLFTWTHIAFTRSGNTITCYINGTSNFTYTDARAFASSANYDLGNSTHPPQGYMAGYRVVRGTAVYTGNFTPPTSPLTAVSGTSLLTMQDAAFTDRSTNNLVLSVSGNPTVTGNSPFNTVGYWSNYFDGGANSLSATSANFAFGTGAWTVEFWIYPLAYGGSVCGAQLFGTTNGSTSGYSINLGQDINSFRLISNATGSWADNLSVGTGNGPSLNTWTHMAVVRSGANISIYKNGTRVATTASATSWNFSGTTGVIGRFSDGSNVRDLNAYLSNLRVANTAIYDPTQSTITVPTAPPTAVSGTQLLTCQNGRIIDNSANTLTITRTGTVSTQSFDPFYTATIASNGGSMYFDGNGDYLLANPNPTASYSFGTGDFTIECWAYVTSLSVYAGLIDTRAVVGASSYAMGLWNTSGNKLDFIFTTSGTVRVTSASTFSLNAWNHFAVTRSSGVIRLFINGILDANSTTFTGAIDCNRSQPLIGAVQDPYYLNGYMSDFRITKGTALYTATFTPTSTPLTPSASTTTLLNGMNAGIYDATAINDMETVGNAQVTTAVSKFGGTSVYFDGTGDYLVAANQPTLNFGTGDFTIEMWININSFSGFVGVLGKRAAEANYSPIVIEATSNVLKLYLSTSGSSWAVNGLSTGTLSTGVWYHYAVSRSGSTVYAFVNGVSVGSTGTASGPLMTNTDPMTIGQSCMTISASVPLNGYIDDFRITNGVARYTSNFTPPTAALPTY